MLSRRLADPNDELEAKHEAKLEVQLEVKLEQKLKIVTVMYQTCFIGSVCLDLDR
jgi:hypothetical protein